MPQSYSIIHSSYLLSAHGESSRHHYVQEKYSPHMGSWHTQKDIKTYKHAHTNHIACFSHN